MKFTYRWGQKPLDGFTIKRGLGQGGFGEVYFAVSDGGKEVALKLIRGHSDTELRGIANCLNLKHPHLVHLYDLRTDSQGDRWLVMEYIHGEPLSSLLNRNPRGLPETQARELFLQAARSVAYLHDHAVVHRDIKPSNIFIENGMVKLGDYGLSKSVGSSQLAQSSNVGTIHYMAPEIASGNYSKQIDIYACGVMLYEMLTGEVPFKGESWAEIAIKHQTDLPKLERVSSGYRTILEKALDKNAARRFRDMGEMITAVESLNPSSSAKPSMTDTVAYVPTIPVPPPLPKPPLPNPGTLASDPYTLDVPAKSKTWRGKVSELATSMALAPVPALAAVLVWAVYSGSLDWPTLGSIYLMTIAVSWSVLVPTKIWDNRKKIGYKRLQMALLGVGLGVFAAWLDGVTIPNFLLSATGAQPLPTFGKNHWKFDKDNLFIGEIVFFTASLFLMRWYSFGERYREDKFSIWPIVGTGFITFLISVVLKGEFKYPIATEQALISLATAAGVIQLVSPWSEKPPARPKKIRLRNT